MLRTIFAVMFTQQLLISVSDDVPRFDVASNCRGQAADAPTTFDGCMRDENKARSTLAAQWSKFLSVDRANCTKETEVYMPSYVDLLSCLEIARDDRKLKGNEIQ